jgi:hypothetical protein
MFFFDPTQIAAAKRRGQALPPRRHGGEGQRAEDAGHARHQFLVTDFKHTVPVKYSGILPDLFREGQGVVAHGRMQTARSSPTRSSPSTTRSTCRPKWPSRSRTIRRRPNVRTGPDDSRTRTFRADPRAVLRGAQAFFGICGRASRDRAGMAVVRPAVAGQFVL